MVKLTPELINSSMQYINPCRDRELDLRGLFIYEITFPALFFTMHKYVIRLQNSSNREHGCFPGPI